MIYSISESKSYGKIRITVKDIRDLCFYCKDKDMKKVYKILYEKVYFYHNVRNFCFSFDEKLYKELKNYDV